MIGGIRGWCDRGETLISATAKINRSAHTDPLWIDREGKLHEGQIPREEPGPQTSLRSKKPAGMRFFSMFPNSNCGQER